MDQFRINPSTRSETPVDPEVYLSLGSNLGDRETRLYFAIRELRRLVRGEVFNASSIYFTQPWGVENQPWFLNAAVRMTTDLKPVDLLRSIEDIERDAGRTIKGGKPQARELDIDILLYGTRQINMEGLIVPHPRLLKRRFVLEPLAELTPELIIPGTGITVLRALEICPDQGSVIRVTVEKR